MPTTDYELKKIAKLAHLETTTNLEHDVSSIMDYVDQLRQIDTTGITPLLNPLDLHQRLRADDANEENCLAELAEIAPLFADNLYLVPKVINKG